MLKTKRIFLSVLSLLLLLSMVGCSPSAASPEGTIKTLFQGLKEYNQEQIIPTLMEFPNTDDCNVTYDLFSDTAYVELYKLAYSKLSYTILDKNIVEEKTATIKLKVNHPDLQSAYSQALYTAASQIFANDDLFNQIMNDESADISNLVPKQMQSMYNSNEIKMIETEYTLQLIFEKNQWRIQCDDQLKNLMSGNLYTITSTIATGTTE